MKEVVDCASCSNYVYDAELDCDVCVVDMDEDQMADFLRGTVRSCPYYQFNDEYVLASRQ